MTVETMTVKLLENWAGWPGGMTLNMMKSKAKDLINRGVAEVVTSTKQVKAPKNRMVTADVTTK